MFKNLFISGAILCSSLLAPAQEALERVHGDILAVLTSDDEVSALILDFHSAFGILPEHRAALFPAMHIHHFSYDHHGLNEGEVLRWFKNNGRVVKAQFNLIVKERDVPNDPLFGNQWHHVNGNDKDIDTDLAWDLTTGGLTSAGDEIVVCVVEGGGAQYQHLDLIGNHWTNTNEVDGNGSDDDNNGYIDDINGWNSNLNNDNISGGGHGTQVSGMIGAKGDNAIGITGVNQNVKIMQVQMGGVTQSSVIAAYNYPYTMRELYNDTGGDRGAFVVAVNSSWGIDGGDPDDAPLWCDMYDTMGEVGILNCGATANNNVNIDVVGDLPTACPSEYLISVTATNDNDVRTFSAYGAVNVDLGAPGEDVYLTNNNNGYTTTSGTSFASPCVAGAVGLLYSTPCSSLGVLAQADPATAAAMIRDAIYNGVDGTTQLSTQTTTGGRLNVNSAMEILIDGCSEGGCFTPSTLSAEAEGTGATVTWNGVGSVLSFVFEYHIAGEIDWTVASGITDEFFIFENLAPCTDYVVRVRADCAEGAVSEYTAELTFTTDGCCEATADVTVNSTGGNLVIDWEPVFAAISYTVIITTMDSFEAFPDITDTEFSHEHQACTAYTIVVETICSGGKDLTSVPVQITSPGCGACQDLPYCESVGENPDEEWLDEVEIGAFSNDSGNDDGYGDFTQTPIPLQTAVPYAVTLTPGFDGFAFNEFYQLWIDLDQDGNFETSEKLLTSTTGASTPFTGTLNIPFTGTQAGITRMRIVMSYIDFQTPAAAACEGYPYGETEDYCVDITVAPRIKESKETPAFTMFPNPANEFVTIVQPLQGDLCTMIARDISGQISAIQSLNAQVENVDVSSWASGIYAIQLVYTSGTSSETRRIAVH